MKNIIHETPTNKLHGRLLFTVKFIGDFDIKNKRILDIGCGFGWCELNFLSRGVKEIIATELTSSDLATIRKNIIHPRLKFAEADATHLPFPDKFFDTVVSWEVLEHIPQSSEKLMFSEVARVLKPGGSFYFSTPGNSLISQLMDPAWWLIGHRHYSPHQIRSYAAVTGFTVQTLVVKGRLWELLGTLNMYLSKWLFHHRPFFPTFFNSHQDSEYQTAGFAGLFTHLVKHL